MLVTLGTVAMNEDMTTQGNKMKANYKKYVHELHGALPQVVYNYIHRCSTAKQIWDTLKENYQGNEKTKKSSIKQCLLELREFKQKENESIQLY